MRRLLLLTLALPLALGGCVSENTNEGISAVGGGGEYDNQAVAQGALAVDPRTKLISAPVSVIVNPKTVVINQRDEARREIVFYGVSIPDPDKYPEVHATALGWLKEQVGDQFSIQVRTPPDADLKSYRIAGQILIPAKSGEGFVSATQAMLSLGLLVYDRPEEVPTDAERRRFKVRQKEAYDAKRGVWKYLHLPDGSR
ncbi:MAG: hypothetical protein KDB07_08815 [Planctomycetes bacterium]|nr:hypothetical protein [Planctomycetota bacterium]